MQATKTKKELSFLAHRILSLIHNSEDDVIYEPVQVDYIEFIGAVAELKAQKLITLTKE